jgi:hypothetical protein
MSQNSNDDYSKYFEVLDTAIEKLVSTKKQYIDKPNRVNSVLFRKQLLELKTVLGQSRQDVLRVNKSKTKKTEVKEEKAQVVEEKAQVVEEKTEVKEEKAQVVEEKAQVTVEVVKEETPEVSPPEPLPEVSTPQPEVKLIAVVDIEKNKRKARIQPNKKPRP